MARADDLVMSHPADRVVIADTASAAPPPGRIPHRSLTTFPLALAWLATRASVRIVQIGANAGDTPDDPLCEFLRDRLREAPAGQHPDSAVILVEPVAHCFEKLTQVYARLPYVRFEQAAIAEQAGQRDFYRLGVDPREHGYPDWMSELGSLRADRMQALWDRYERQHAPRSEELKRFYQEHLVIESVRCLTLRDLLDRHHVRELDLLLIDAEGYDFEILKTLDLDRVRPAFINYERVLLEQDAPACRAMLERAGYILTDWGLDTLCTRTR
jgi:FkbM family methyltransferase